MYENEKWKWSRSVMSLRDLTDWRLPGSSIYGILQARVLEWGAIAFSGGHGEWVLSRSVMSDSLPPYVL